MTTCKASRLRKAMVRIILREVVITCVDESLPLQNEGEEI